MRTKLARVYSAALQGLDAYPVEVQVASKTGMPGMTIIGLPDTVIRESKDRIRASIYSTHLEYKKKYYVINLAPADTQKVGAAFDLPIALGMLASMGHIPREAFDKTLVVGELSLDGLVRPTRGVLSTAMMARAHGYTRFIVPRANADEAALIPELEVFPVEHLEQAVQGMQDPAFIERHRIDVEQFFGATTDEGLDFSEVRGQSQAKRMLEIAAAGGHNVLLRGSPGCGKSMMIRRMPSILPPLSLAEALEVTRIYSIAGTLANGVTLMTRRPFRHPHHTASHISLVGGGSFPRPGEVSLAHRGVLFLDEMPEFRREVLEVLRQPLEDGVVTIGRALTTLTFPARFMLIGAMNPCKCGYLNDAHKDCLCLPGQVARYRSRISGPLLDRIDLQMDVPRVKESEWQNSDTTCVESSEHIRQRVNAARLCQQQRFVGAGVHYNAEMGQKQLKQFCELASGAQTLLERAMTQLRFSARVYHRILKVARTIADLQAHGVIEVADVAEAIQYRGFSEN